jgi:AcrR family transcriptional regulator
MKTLNTSIQINQEIYLRDPKATELGRKILDSSIILIDRYGLEDFNFKKLAQRIGSTESSIYRYFENKHYLFIYLINWYWECTSTRIDIATINISDPKQKVEKIIKTLTEASFIDMDMPFIDEEILHKIIIREGAKAYHHKTVDNQNEYGFFLSYKSLCKKISQIFLEINPSYKYPKALASTLVETCNNNIYFAKHLPRLTDLNSANDDETLKEDLFDMLYEMIFANLHFKTKQKSIKEQ